MEMTKMKDARKRMDKKKSGPDPLLDLAGWVSVIFGVILVLLGLWTQFHGESGPLTASYRDDTVYVEAMYGKEARIPKEAELRARLITPEEDPEMYLQEMATAMAAAGRDDEAVPTNAIYNVGFYVGDQEVEPAAPVNVTVQVLKDGFAAGEPVRVVHLREDDAAEVLADTSVDDAGFISFTTDGFSSFAFMLKPEEETGNRIIKTEARKSDEGEYSLYAIIGDPEGQKAAKIAMPQGDMTRLVSDVTITDKKGEKVKDGKLYVGEKYTIHLKFREEGLDKQFSWEEPDGTMTYDIPSNFDVTERENIELKIRFNEEDVVIGEYSVKDGKLIVQLNEEGRVKLKGAANIELSFDMEATAQKTEDGGDEDVNFGETGEDFKFEVTNQPQITVNKVSTYNSDKSILNYTVSTKIDHGPVQDIVVSDTLTPPKSNGITLEMVNGEDEKPDIKVTVIRDGETITLTAADYELIPAETNPGDPYAPQNFQVKLKGSYNPLRTDDELQVTYQYEVKFNRAEAEIYWAQVVNEAVVTGSMPMESTDPESGEEKGIPVEEKQSIYTEVGWESNGEGVVSKAQSYSETDRKLHYTLYAAVKGGGEYTPFYITDRATVEYGGRTWIVKGFDNNLISSLKVYAQDIDNWSDLDENGTPKPGTSKGKKLTGYMYGTNPEGYSSENIDNYIYQINENTTDLYIYFGMDNTGRYPQGHWNYGEDRLMTVEYDLDVSEGLTLYDEKNGETKILTKEQVLLAGIKNTVHLRYGPFYPGYSVFFSNGEKLNKSGKLDKVNNTIDYTVSLKLEDTTVWDYMKDVKGKPIVSAAFYDKYAEGWDYVDGSLKATLYRKYDVPIEYIYDFINGPASWQYNNEDDKGDFHDGDIKAYLWNFRNSEKGDLPYALTNAFDNLVDRLEFTYTLKASEDWLKEHVNDGSDTVIYNEAQIMDNTIKRWSADEDVLYFTNRLTKTAVQDGTSNLIRFTLEINTLGANLNPTEDYLIVTDESTGIQIKKDSIEVFKVSAKGEESKLNKLGATTVDADMTSEQWGLLSAESENQYKLKVPDKVHLRIKYEALITEMGDVKISNKASIDGVERAEDSYEKILKVDEIFAGGSGGTYQMEIEKVDSKHTDKKLANAKFKLYIVGEESSDLTETKQITVGSTEYTCHSEKESEFITDEDGRCIITKWFLIPGSYYILEEITPPDGYQSLEPILFYFGLKDAETDPDVEIVPPDGTLIIADPPIEYNLPETGGPGTLFYIVTGLALVLGSRILLMVRRRLRQAR